MVVMSSCSLPLMTGSRIISGNKMPHSTVCENKNMLWKDIIKIFSGDIYVCVYIYISSLYMYVCVCGERERGRY